MSIIGILRDMPRWYDLIIIAFSVYYAWRGVMEQRYIQRHSYKGDLSCSTTEKVVIHYIQEVLFKSVITVSSFMALFIANYIFSSLKSYTDISSGTALFLIFLIVWGIIGVSGYLTHLIVSGKAPGLK